MARFRDEHPGRGSGNGRLGGLHGDRPARYRSQQQTAVRDLLHCYRGHGAAKRSPDLCSGRIDRGTRVRCGGRIRRYPMGSSQSSHRTGRVRSYFPLRPAPATHVCGFSKHQCSATNTTPSLARRQGSTDPPDQPRRVRRANAGRGGSSRTSQTQAVGRDDRHRSLQAVQRHIRPHGG